VRHEHWCRGGGHSAENILQAVESGKNNKHVAFKGSARGSEITCIPANDQRTPPNFSALTIPSSGAFSTDPTITGGAAASLTVIAGGVRCAGAG
jgi:hypothetical protein